MQPAEGGRVFTRQCPTQPSTARKAKQGEVQPRGQGQRPGSVSQEEATGCDYRRCLEGKALECPSQAVKSLMGLAEVLPSRQERNR